MTTRDILFGPFRFDPATRVLWDGETPARLGARALAILGRLLETPGTSVSRDELMRVAWPGLHVDQSNLRVQISTLRKALREHGSAIQSSAAQGYRFAGDIVIQETASSPARHRLRVPSPLTPPIGRETVVVAINALFAGHRLVSIVGPGGIGKTTVAMQVASGRMDDYSHGACFVDLGRLSASDSVNATIASSAHLTVNEWPSNEQIALALCDRHMLLVLDCCEHVITPVSQLVEHLLATTSSIDILVTTREPLRADNEKIWQLEPLAIPPASGAPTEPPDLEDYSAVQLLLQSIRRRGADLQIGDATSAGIADICRRLDGIPLAIELAASMIAALGLPQVLRSLDENTPLIKLDRRSTTPRQRSLFATIEWSYNLLSSGEQATLQRLSCFAGPFTVDAGVAIAQDDGLPSERARDVILALAHKSLLTSQPQFPDTYRLLDTTRSFVADTPDPADNRGKARDRHANYILDRLAQTDWDFEDVQSANAKVGHYVDEVRVALDWSFTAAPRLGVQLVLAAERLWLELTSLFHGAPHIARALDYAETDPDLEPGMRARLLVSLASAQAYIPGAQGAALYERAWAAARYAGDDFLELRALYGLIQSLLLTRQPAASLLDAFAAISKRSDHPATYRLYQRMHAFSEFEASNLASARQQFESFLSDFEPIPRSISLYLGGMDSVISSKVGLALSKYYLGYCDQACLLLEETAQQAERAGHATTSYFVLAQGAIWANINSRDFERAHAYLAKLQRLADHYRPWQALVDAFGGLIAIYERGDAETGAQLLTSCLQDPYLIKTGSLRPVLWIELADARRQLGDFAGAEAALANAWEQCLGASDTRLVGKHHPIRAHLLMTRNAPGDITEARRLLHDAIDLSRTSDFYLYECEATVILAELESTAGDNAAARRALTDLVTRHGDRENVPFFARAKDLLASIDAASEGPL